jgi:cardiolipin synthase
LQRKGEIIEQKYVEEVDYGNLEIGDAWTQKELPQTEVSLKPFKTATREIFPIPSDNKDEFVNFLSNTVNQSQAIVCLSSYMMQQSALTNAILAAASRGVRIYVLTSGEEELARDDTDMDDVDKAKLKDYKQLLNSMAGQVLIRTAPHFHAKFLLVDPQAEHGTGVMMTCNATLDAMTGKNFEVATTLTVAEVTSFFSQFVRAFWQESKHELLRAGELSDVRQAPKSVSFGQIKHPATFTGCTTLRERVQGLIDSAEKTIVATGWSFGAKHEIIASLSKAIERGVKVKIFSRVAFGNTEALAALAAKGAMVEGHDRYHAKMLIADSNSLLMTSNFTERGLDTGFETAVELKCEETDALIAIVNHWESLCDWRLHPNLKLKDATPLILSKTASTKKLDVFKVSDAVTKDLPAHAIISLDEPLYKPLFEATNPNIPPAGNMYKKVIYTWRVSPAVLPTRAYRVESERDSLPLYRTPNGEYFVAVFRWEDVETARRLANKWKAKIVLQKRKGEFDQSQIRP